MQQVSWRRISAALAVAGAAFLLPQVVRAQTGKISGVVTDATSGSPIEGVQVVVQGTGYGSITQPNGRYFIIGVPPGTYTVVARRIGYASTQFTGVQVVIDVTREQGFKLNTAATTLTTQTIVAESTPLVERGTTGSSTTITAEAIENLPVTNINGVLALQQGFVDVPQNTQLMSLAEEQRSTISPIRVRGGRGGATVTLVDGFPVNNPIFGSAAINLNAQAISGVEFVRGYMEPQYGNGLSGVINQAVREGGSEVAGRVNYQTSAIAGALGSRPDELNGSHNFQGNLSGPVPGTAARVRYSVSGEISTSAANVLEFDNDVFSYNDPQAFVTFPPDVLDLTPGWRAFGGRQNRQIVGKLTFLPTSTLKINVLGIDQERQTARYDRRNFRVYTGDPWSLATNIVDSLGNAGRRTERNILQSAVHDQSRLYGVSAEQRFGRTLVQLRGSRSELTRLSCNIFLGACVPQPFTNPNFSENFRAAFTVPGIPYPGSDLVYGGEDYNTNSLRADIQSQLTDHHNAQVGASYLRHDITYNELRGLSGQQSGFVPAVPQLYRAKPIEAAFYLQDRIEYDFLTVRIGARYDYGKAKGRGFSDPLNPTNNTTARDVCAGEAPGLGATTAFQYQTKNAAKQDSLLLTGVAACLGSPALTSGGKPFLLDSATRLAQTDDFRDAKARTAFSPRIGVSFPLTERSQVFFNAGRYTMNPLYHNLYRNSGVGTVAGSAASGRDGFCADNETKPGTSECVPPLRPSTPEFIGNPNLLLEQATQYEVGYASQFARIFSVNVAMYNRDETGLSGIVQSRPVQDIGTTYAGQALPAYTTIVNQDFLTARGVELQFRRAPSNRWSFDISYGWSRVTTNSPPPERSAEIEESGELDRTKLTETLADIDQTHNFNMSLGYQVRRDVPKFRYGHLLRNTSASLTYSFRSGFPYTPVDALTQGQVTNSARAADINTGRAPTTQDVGAQLRKDFSLGNVRYGVIVRANNLFDRKNCNQVFVNTGNCDAGLRDATNRRVGNNGESTSTSYDQPEYIGARRSINAGLTISF